MVSRIVFFSAVAALAAGCGTPQDEAGLEVDEALYALVTTVDGTSFYPPLGPSPVPITGPFDASVPDLRVALETTDALGNVVVRAEFHAHSNPALYLFLEREMYFVDVPAATYFTDPSLAYRFRVTSAGVELGRSDLSSRVFEVMQTVPNLTVGVKLRIEARPAPVLSAISPTSATAGTGDLTITVDGASFAHDSVVRSNGVALATTFVSSSRLTALLPAAALASVGTVSLDVSTPLPGGGTSSSAAFEIISATPVLDAISPSSILSGYGATLTLTGSRFSTTSFATLDGAPLATTFVSATELQATLDASGTLVLGNRSVAVTTPGGGSSEARTLTVLDSSAYTMLAAGGDYGRGVSCGIRRDGSLWCWGANADGQLGDGTTTARAVPRQVGTATWAEISLGGAHACGLHPDGTLWCWGSSAEGQLGTGGYGTQLTPVQIGTATWAHVSAGREFTCGIQTNGTMWCWGRNLSGGLGDGTRTSRLVPTQVGTDANWASVSAGGFSTCALRTDGTQWCWGMNFYGELGDGTTTDRLTPVQIGAGSTWIEVASGNVHTCALRADGTAWCSGDSAFGQVGDGTTTRVQVLGGGTFTHLAAANAHTCGLRADGSAWCWGNGTYGQIGDGGQVDRTSPAQVAGGTFTAIAANGRHACGLRADGTAACWGSDADGQLGNGQGGNKLQPTQVGTDRWSSVSAGEAHTCARRTDDSMWCWGWNAFGQLGNGTLASLQVPGPVTSSARWTSVSAGSRHNCGTVSGGGIQCWGVNQNGQLGDGTTTWRTTPVAVTSSTWTQVRTGGNHTCGLRSDGSLWCWGYNTFGQVGNGFTSDMLAPARIGGFVNTWTTGELGYAYTCFVRTGGTLWCWGQNGSGQLGDGTSSPQRNTAVQVGTATDWAQVAAGESHTCGRRTDGSVWCWGDGYLGKLGDGSGAGSFVPLRVHSGASSLCTGQRHTCALNSDGTLWCWGGNASGQLGIGSTASASTPTRVGTGTSWASISCGDAHTCATRTDGTLWCWGATSEGQLGTGSSWRGTPVQVN